MPTATYVPLATQTLGSASASITFSSIPSGYTDLRLVVNFATGSTSTNPRYRFNGDTATNYSNQNMLGNGSTTAGGSNTSLSTIAAGANISASFPATHIFNIFSYTNTSIYKTGLLLESTDNNGSGSTVAGVALWRGTAAITSITVLFTTGTMNTGTTATIWGI